MSRFRKMLVSFTSVILLLMLCIPVLAGATASSGSTARTNGEVKSGPVFIIPVDQEIERGLQSFWSAASPRRPIMERC